MTDRPLEIVEMGIRTWFQVLWKLGSGLALVWFGWPVLIWVSGGFIGFPFEQSWMTAGQFLAALIGPFQVLAGLRLYFFAYLPFVIARRRHSGSPDLRRR